MNTSQRTRTTYTFRTQHQATYFKNWLVMNSGDNNYGVPKFIDLRDVGRGEFCVEYEYESDKPVARGVAIGIEHGIKCFSQLF